MPRTRHAQYDIWAMNILCILAVVGSLHLTWKKTGKLFIIYYLFIYLIFIYLLFIIIYAA